MLKKFLFIVCFVGACATGKTQNSTVDSSAIPIIANAGAVYNSFITKESRIYNGIEHLGYSYKIKGFAYFHQRELQLGSIVYDDLEFTNVPMLYDLLKDQVVIRHFNNFTLIGLVKEKVSSFTLFNHHFIRLPGDSLHGSYVYAGFYDEMYHGHLLMLVRRTKYIEETIKSEVEREFISKDLYYIKKDATYHNIKTYKGLLAVFPDKAKEIKQYLRRNKIKFRKDRETAIVKAVAYYDSLTR